MKKLSKILALLMVLCMLASLSAFASEEEYDVNAERFATFGVITADDEASSEASGEVYDHYVDETVAYDTYDFDGTTYGTNNGYLTVTCEGVQFDPADLNGTYTNVVFTVTPQIPAFVDGYESAYRTALYYDEDGLEEDYSVTSAVIAGDYDDNGATNVYIDSQDDNFEGMIFAGGTYTVNNLTMVAEGNGTNDFAGVGAGVAVGGNAHVTLNDYEFIAHGVIRHGMFIGGDDENDAPVLTVNNGLIVTGNPQAEDGTTMYEKTSDMSMSSSPWMLGIEATPEVRSQLMASHGTTYYNDTTIISSGWGVVSSDAVDSPANWGDYTIQMNLNNCVLDFTGTSGYISYAIGATHNSFINCTIGNAIGSGVLDDTAEYLKETYDYDLAYESGVQAADDGNYYNTTYALIVANETSGGTFDNCVYTGQYGVMYHKTNNVRYVPDSGSHEYTDADYAGGYTLIKDSTFNTQGAALLIKACTPCIYVENSALNSATGVIVQLAVCDDPGMGNEYFSEILDTTAEVEADPDYNPYDYNTKDQTIFDFNIEDMINDVQVEFSDCTGDTALNGSFYNSITVSTTGEGMTWWGQNLILSFDNCEINGNISSSTALHNAYSGYYDADGNEVAADNTEDAIAAGAVTGRITSDNATYLGWMTNSTSATVNNGVWATLTNGTVWTPIDTCYLTVLNVEEGCTINGTVTVDGEAVDVTAGGSWTGTIVVEPAAAEEAAPAEEAAAEEATPATDGTENQNNTLDADVAPATQEEFDAYKAYLVDYMNSYTGEGDGTGFDDSAKTMAIGELDSVGFGSDVYAFPFEMFVTQFGAQTFAEFIAG